MKKKPNKATPDQRERWERLRALGCIVCGSKYLTLIHHAQTGMGGRKNHDKVIPLCFTHHQGEQGLHTLSRRVWEARYGTEQELMTKAKQLLGENND